MDKPNIEILRVLFARRKHILLVTLVAAILALAVSFVLKPKYRSISYIYPANMVPFFLEQQNKGTSHTELLLQFFNSNDVRTRVLKRFHLERHYQLDTTDYRFKTYFNYLYEENIKVSQTRYESVELNVLDTDPDTAQKIAQGIIDAVNDVIQKQHTIKFNEYIAVNLAYRDAHRRALDSLQRCMEEFTKKYHLVEIKSQMREVAQNYFKLMAEGRENAKITQAYNEIAERGPEYYRLSDALKKEASLYAKVENEVAQSIRDFSRKLTYMIVASEPSKPDSKYWPKRGMITGLAALSAFVLACLYFAYAARLREVWVSIKTPPGASN
jgi:LPS O-antigen subunit length determinant protein (WzzB/FepE family)